MFLLLFFFFKLVSQPQIPSKVFSRGDPPTPAALGSAEFQSCLPYYGKSLQATLVPQASKRSSARSLPTKRSHWQAASSNFSCSSK